MAYKDNVSVLCMELGITNPIQEEDLHISFVTFHEGHLSVSPRVEATDMNRAGRLFVEWLVIHNNISVGMRRDQLYFGNYERTIAQLYFGDLWLDTSETHRTLIHGLKTANMVRIGWK